MANVNVKFDQRQLKRVQSMLRDIPRAQIDMVLARRRAGR